MLVRLFALVVLLGLSAPAVAHGYDWPTAYTPVAHNPADALAGQPIEDTTYDAATHCAKKERPGMTALVKWLGTHVGGQGRRGQEDLLLETLIELARSWGCGH